MNVLQLLASSNFIVLNKNVINVLGLEEALILGELSSEYDYWIKRGELDDGWFFSTVENIENNTTLNDYKQRKAIDNLIKMNIIEVKVKGLPAKRYFKINEEQVIKLLNIKFSNNLSYSSQNFKELDIKNLKSNNNIINNNKINKNKDKDSKPTRHKYGEYKNVLLSDEELEKLKKELPNTYEYYIDRLSEYMASSGKHYKSHLATIRVWARKDKDKKSTISELPSWFDNQEEIKTDTNVNDDELKKMMEKLGSD